jgi:hypothetical protein
VLNLDWIGTNAEECAAQERGDATTRRAASSRLRRRARFACADAHSAP